MLLVAVVAGAIGVGIVLAIAARRSPPPTGDAAARVTPSPGQTFVNGLGAEMVWVAATTAWMGSVDLAPGSDERLHRVQISHGYWIAATELTRAEWCAWMPTRPWRTAGVGDLPSDGDVPASGMSHDEATEFCQLLSARERAHGWLGPELAYRLPTEAEWELACRAGSTGIYCCEPAELAAFAVFAAARDGAHPHRVRSRRPNAWGLFDVHGNVWEWCADAAAMHLLDGAVEVVTDTYRDGIVDPCGSVGPERVCRGGSYAFSAPYLRSANRMACARDVRSLQVGFRIILAGASSAPDR